MTRNEAVNRCLMTNSRPTWVDKTANWADVFDADSYRRLKKIYDLPNEPILHSKSKSRPKKVKTDRQRQQDNRKR